MTVPLRLLTVAVSLMLASSAWAATYSDPTHGFKITTPGTWKTKAYSDAADRMFDAMSRDGNVMVRVRALKLPNSVSLDKLRQVYQRKYVSGVKPHRSRAMALGGLKGRIYHYNWKYKGHPIDVRTFFAAHNGKAYIVSRIVPKKFVKARGAEADRVVASFRVKGVRTAPVKPKPESKPESKAKPGPPMKAKRPGHPSGAAPAGDMDLHSGLQPPLTKGEIDEVMADYFDRSGE